MQITCQVKQRDVKIDQTLVFVTPVLHSQNKLNQQLVRFRSLDKGFFNDDICLMKAGAGVIWPFLPSTISSLWNDIF